jgi:hypothetical protein
VAYLVAIASAYRTEDPGFESSQDVKFLAQCCCQQYNGLPLRLKEKMNVSPKNGVTIVDSRQSFAN